VSALSEYVIASDEKGRRWAVGPVMARHVDQLRAAVAEHGWTVAGTATHLSVYAFRAARGRRRDRGERR
jgi:hypothetical protein